MNLSQEDMPGEDSNSRSSHSMAKRGSPSTDTCTASTPCSVTTKKMKVSREYTPHASPTHDMNLHNDMTIKPTTQAFTQAFASPGSSPRDSDDDFQSISESMTILEPQGLDNWLQTFQAWTNSERMSALESLVTNEHCDIQQIRFLLSLIEPQLQRDFISLLPKELALYVLSFLEPKDLVKAAQSCRKWRILCEDNLLWRDKCREEGLLEDHETVVDLFRKRSGKTRNHASPTACESGENDGSASISLMPFVASEYKAGFLRQKTIEHNWRNGMFPSDPETNGNASPATSSKKTRYLRAILQLKGHDDHVITCLQFNPTSK